MNSLPLTFGARRSIFGAEKMDFSNSKSAHRSLTRRGKDQLALRFEHFFSDAAADIDAASQELQLQEIQEMLVETKMEWEGAALALLLYTERIVIKIRAAVQASASDDSAAGDIALGMEGLVRQILDTATDNLLHALEHNEPRVRKLASKGIHSISSSLLVGQHAPHVLPASHAAQSGSSSSSDSSYVRQEHGEKAPCGNISSDSDSEDDDKKTATSTANTTGTKTESGLSASASAGARASYLQSQQRRLRRKQQTAATVAHLQLHFYQRSSPLLLAAIRASILRFEKSRPAALGGVGPENSKTVPLGKFKRIFLYTVDMCATIVWSITKPILRSIIHCIHCSIQPKHHTNKYCSIPPLRRHHWLG